MTDPTKQALLEAFDDVLKAEAERAGAEPAAKPGKRRISPVVAAGLFTIFALAAAIAATQPPWLGFPDTYVEPPAVEDASLRLAMYQARQRVEQYHTAHGKLPATLLVAGVTDESLRMTVVSGSQYVIEGGSDSTRLALRSDEPVRPFLGDAFNVVSGGRSK